MPTKTTVSSTDRDILRRLAAEVTTIAQQPVQQERRLLWQALNDLRPQRPMLWITEIPWREFEDKVDALRPVCRDARCRALEQDLRRRIFTAHRLTCDAVMPDAYEIPKVIRDLDYGVEISERQISQGDAYIQSHHYEPVISDFGDLEKILMPEVRFDAAETESRVAAVRAIFGDLLPVRAVGIQQHFFNGWDCLVRWTGVTEALMALMERPDFIHAVMRRMTDSFLRRMTRLESEGLLEDSRPLARVGSGAAGWTGDLPQPDADPRAVRITDQWGGATAQIFSEVSPAMHAEFALAYEIEVMSRCGLNYYGCCEPLHNKMSILAAVPRLRKISISPWCNVAKAVEMAAQPYVFSHKPNPAILAEDRFNAERAGQELRERLAQSGTMPCEFILKDISTVRGDVERVIAWCETAWRALCG